MFADLERVGGSAHTCLFMNVRVRVHMWTHVYELSIVYRRCELAAGEPEAELEKHGELILTL